MIQHRATSTPTRAPRRISGSSGGRAFSPTPSPFFEVGARRPSKRAVALALAALVLLLLFLLRPLVLPRSESGTPLSAAAQLPKQQQVQQQQHQQQHQQQQTLLLLSLEAEPSPGAAPPAASLVHAGPARSPYSPRVVAPGYHLMLPPRQYIDAFERDAFYDDDAGPAAATGGGEAAGGGGGGGEIKAARLRPRPRRRWHLTGLRAALASATGAGSGSAGGGCVVLARSVAEPMSEAYEPRWLAPEEEEVGAGGAAVEEKGAAAQQQQQQHRKRPRSSSSSSSLPQNKARRKKAPPPLELAGGVPRVAWRWEQDVAEEDDEGGGGKKKQKKDKRVRTPPLPPWTKRRFFEALPFDLRAALDPPAPSTTSPSPQNHPHPCPHCSFALRYKTYNGSLFVESARRKRSDLGAGGAENAAAFEEALLAGMHLYDVPDADFAVHLGDGAVPAEAGLLLLQQNIDRGSRRAGVAAPFFAWRDALGPGEQMPALASCLDARFPRDAGASPGAARAAAEAGAGGGLAGDAGADASPPPAAKAAPLGSRLGLGGGSSSSRGSGRGRLRRPASAPPRIPRAFWRGSSTDPRINPVDEANLLDVGRARLALAGRWWPGLFDAAITGHPQQAFSIASTEHGGGNAAEVVLPLGEKVEPMDRANAWAVAVDADGNGWSDRFRHLALASTPLLKQASNLTAFFEHVVAAPVAGAGAGAGAGVLEVGGGGTEEGEGEEEGYREQDGEGLVDAFAPDAFDLGARARGLMAALGTEQGARRVRRRVARRRAVAAAMLSQPAVAEAAAAAVAVAARLSDWEVDAPALVGAGGVVDGRGGRFSSSSSSSSASSSSKVVLYEEVPRSRCCTLAAVPRAFAEAVRNGGGGG